MDHYYYTWPTIEFGTPEMVHAWADGIEGYRPTYEGRKLQDEGGITAASLANIRRIMRKTRAVPSSIIAGPKQTMLFLFPKQGSYLATGFATGYLGEGPAGLGEIAEECGFGNSRQLLDEICSLPKDLQGVLFHRGFVSPGTLEA